MKKVIILGVLLFSISLNVVNGENISKFEKILQFKSGQFGYATLTSKDNLLILNMSSRNNNQWVDWYQSGKILKSIKDAGECLYSPNDKYYAFTNLKNNIIYINDIKDKTVASFQSGKNGAYYTWSYDSEHLIICDVVNPLIYKFDILTKGSEKISELNKNYFNPVTIKNNNVIYLLLNKTPDAPDTNCDIVKYDIQSKKVETLKFPYIEELWIYSEFTVSPDEKIAVFQNSNDNTMYVVDVEKSRIIDKIKLPPNSILNNFNWKSDSSYLLFTTTMKEVYKYTIPKH